MSQETLAYAAIALRCFGLIVSLPFHEAITIVPRFFLAVGLAFVFFPITRVSPDLGVLSLIVEFVIGFVLCAPLRLIADVSEMVGELIDTARGQTISAVLDPLNGQGNSDLATLLKNGAIVMALLVGALEVTIAGLAESLQVIPVGGVVVEESLVMSIFRSGIFLLGEGLRGCAVWVGAFLVVDLICVFASRLVSGLHFTQTSGVVKMVVTLLLLLALFNEGARFSRQDIFAALVPWKREPAVGSIQPRATPVATPNGPAFRPGGEGGNVR